MLYIVHLKGPGYYNTACDSSRNKKSSFVSVLEWTNYANTTDFAHWWCQFAAQLSIPAQPYQTWQTVFSKRQAELVLHRCLVIVNSYLLACSEDRPWWHHTLHHVTEERRDLHSQHQVIRISTAFIHIVDSTIAKSAAIVEATVLAYNHSMANTLDFEFVLHTRKACNVSTTANHVPVLCVEAVRNLPYTLPEMNQSLHVDMDEIELASTLSSSILLCISNKDGVYQTGRALELLDDIGSVRIWKVASWCAVRQGL